MALSMITKLTHMRRQSLKGDHVYAATIQICPNHRLQNEAMDGRNASPRYRPMSTETAPQSQMCAFRRAGRQFAAVDILRAGANLVA